MKRILLVAALPFLVTGCSGSEPPEQVAETSSPTPVQTTAAPSCPNQNEAVTDASMRTGSPGSGDVDGDGNVDSVAIHFDPAGEPGCQAFVVSESASGVAAAPLETWRADFGLPAPTVNTLQEVDGEPGLEVVVNMGAGASAQFVGIVTSEDGVLAQVTTEAGEHTVGDGLLGYGGSVGHLEAVDCAPEGGIVSSFAAPFGRVYRVERRFLVFDGARLVEDRVETARASLAQIDRFPEYAASPFGSCSD